MILLLVGMITLAASVMVSKKSKGMSNCRSARGHLIGANPLTYLVRGGQARECFEVEECQYGKQVAALQAGLDELARSTNVFRVQDIRSKASDAVWWPCA